MFAILFKENAIIIFYNQVHVCGMHMQVYVCLHVYRHICVHVEACG